MSHDTDIIRATTPLGAWVAVCACGWTDTDPRDAHDAAIAAARHSLATKEPTTDGR